MSNNEVNINGQSLQSYSVPIYVAYFISISRYDHVKRGLSVKEAFLDEKYFASKYMYKVVIEALLSSG